MTRKLSAIVLLALVFSLSANAQICTKDNAPASPNTEAISGIGQYANLTQTASHQHGSIYFVGKVVVEGGQLPWDAIPVVVNCNGATRYHTQTDSKGSFRIELAATSREVAGAKPDPNNLAPVQLAGCQVRADLEGFQSSKVTIANSTILGNPDIGTISLHIEEGATGSAISTTTASAPKDALKDFDKAHVEEIANHPESAQKDLEKAVRVDPQFAEAWYQLGKIEEAAKPQDAMNAFSKAAAADPFFISPYQHIAALSAQQKKWRDVVDATGHALKLDPDGTPQLWYLNAVGNYNLGHTDVAETSARTSLAMDPSHEAPNTEQLLAVMLAARRDYPGALEHLRNCLTYMPPGPNADMIKQQVAQLEKIVTKASK